MWTALGALLTFLIAIGPAIALSVYEMQRWRRETGRKASWLAMRYDSDYQRAARRSGRAYLSLLIIPWFFLWFVVCSQFLVAL